MPNETTFHPRYLHSDSYYFAVLHGLIDGLKAHKTHQEIAELLTSKGLIAPTGKQWTANSVKCALYNLRNRDPHQRASRLYQKLIRYVFDGVMAAADYLVLFEKRQPNTAQ